MQDLVQERELARAIVKAEGLTCLNAEAPHPDFNESPYELSIDYARACDLYLLIIGRRYGSRPEGMPQNDSRSVTHLEFEIARAANPRKIRILMPTDAWEIAEDERQRTFLSELGNFRNGYDYFRYDRHQPGALTAKIQQIVREWLESGLAGRDAYMSQVQADYATFTNPVMGTQMHYEATVALRLRTQPRGRAATWDAQMEAEERRRLRRVRGGDRRSKSAVEREGREERQPEQLRQAFQPLIAQADEFLKRFGRLVVLGDPGAGKTTLLKRLAHEAALDYFQRPDAALIPVVMSAARLGEMFAGSVPRTTAELAHGIGTIKAAETKEAALRPTIATTVENAIDGGRALLLVDGLDEATAAEQRAVISALAQVGTNQAMLTARFGTLTEGALVVWEVCETQRLDDFERRRLIDQVFDTLLQVDGTEPAHPPNADTLIAQLDERADLLIWSGNPLLLTLIATQFARDRQLPTNRARIYEFAVEDMQHQRPLTARRLLTQREFENRLRLLALSMFEAQATVVTEQQMLAILQAAERTTTEAIVSELLDRSGIFLLQTKGADFFFSSSDR